MPQGTYIKLGETRYECLYGDIDGEKRQWGDMETGAMVDFSRVLNQYLQQHGIAASILV